MKEKFRKKEKANELKIGSLLFERAWRTVITVLLIVGIILVFVTNFRTVYFKTIPAWYVQLPLFCVLLTENVLKIWFIHRQSKKIPCYVIDSILLILLTMFSDGTLVSTLYIIILSEFYISQKSVIANIAMGVTSIGLFLIAFAVSNSIHGESVSIVRLVTSAFNDLLLITFHFLLLNFTTQIFRKNREINKAFNELNESNRKLGEAYRELQEVTALEERQRIAKDIHDTAGHSITTVIMQTEAAKLVMDSDPEEAKRRVAAANLQAKNALEELRESVHLLSGKTEQLSLKSLLEGIVQDSTDGTDITVRSDIDDIAVCDAKRRFICNSLKEGISNGLRHGAATAFWFELKEADGEIRFLLSDNGKGVAQKDLKEGFGISGMYRRAESLGGTAWVESEQGEGFEVHITLPTDGEKETL